jgi:hypothetical protein
MGAFGGSSDSQQLTLDFAKPPMKEVLNPSQKGQKGQSGLLIKAAFRLENKNLMLDMEITNHSGVLVADFDIMFNKNPFGIAIYNVANQVVYP